MERNYGQVLPNTPIMYFDAMFARLVYDYNYKYVFSGSVRRDRSSKFGPDKRAGWFYSGSLAWNITEEDFMKDIHWLDIAKLRVSYGITGNDQIGNDYAWISTISSDQKCGVWYNSHTYLLS